jgi:hypothetical protein
LENDWSFFYYLYALERYYSYHELAAGKWEKEPKWYSDAARWLVNHQEDNGSWTPKMKEGVSPCGATPDTAFATLFLLRSSKKSIEKAFGFGDSILVVGRGLPSQTGKVAVSGGKVVPELEWKTAEQLLPVLEKDGGGEFEKGIEALAQLPAREIGRLAAGDADLLRRLAADKSPKIRLAAVRAIGRSDQLDLMPVLIYALGDPDGTVAVEACDAVRRLTRTPGKRAVTQELTPLRRREEIQYWKEWYLAVRPDAQFDD